MANNTKITKRSVDYTQWYLDIIEAADLAEHSPVKGCMTIKPYGYAIWEHIQKVLDTKFKETGVENAYFPLFIPESFMKKEADHIEGFAPEIAVVTHAGGKKLEENLIVRPTSETIIGEAFARWVKSYRDLPMILNQWANAVRWELRTRFFLRTSEFLWQEGHTVHATEQEAAERTQQMLKIYQALANDYFAMAVIPGQKSESEKFAGADKTYSIEAMMQDGKALQAGTSHMLGQNFSKAFDIRFSDENNQLQYVWQTSWGVTTRLIGGLVMTHSDDEGLVLPPKIAPITVVIVPITKEGSEKGNDVLSTAERIKTMLSSIEDMHTIKIDIRDIRPGEKFFEWEKKGIPVRIEIGEKDIAQQSVVVYQRDTKEKHSIKINELVVYISNVLSDMQQRLFDHSTRHLAENTISVADYDAFKQLFEKENKFVLAYWCEDKVCEAKVKEETKATTRCIPFVQEKTGGKCIICGKQAQRKVIFAKAY